MVADDTANLGMGVIRLAIFQLAFVGYLFKTDVNKGNRDLGSMPNKPGLLDLLGQRKVRQTMAEVVLSRSRHQVWSRSRWHG
jgi:hypothetical protein